MSPAVALRVALLAALVPIGLLALVTAMLVASFELSPIAGGVPRTALVLLLALLLAQTVRDMRRGLRMHCELRESPTGSPAASPELRSAAYGSALGWLAGQALAVVALGPVAGPSLFALAYMRLRGAESWRASVALALAVLLSLAVLFQTLLEADPWPSWS